MNTEDKFTTHIDLTPDVGATIKVWQWSSGRVNLYAGGDLNIGIVMPPESAIALGEALIAAANIAKTEEVIA